MKACSHVSNQILALYKKLLLGCAAPATYPRASPTLLGTSSGASCFSIARLALLLPPSPCPFSASASYPVFLAGRFSQTTSTAYPTSGHLFSNRTQACKKKFATPRAQVVAGGFWKSFKLPYVVEGQCCKKYEIFEKLQFLLILAPNKPESI